MEVVKNFLTSKSIHILRKYENSLDLFGLKPDTQMKYARYCLDLIWHEGYNMRSNSISNKKHAKVFYYVVMNLAQQIKNVRQSNKLYYKLYCIKFIQFK